MEEDLNTDFDVIVLGTGVTESLVAAASARVGKKVLHLDRNSYYGGLWASFSLNGLEDWIKSVNSTSDEKEDVCVKPTLEDTESWINLSNPNSLYHAIKYEYSHNEESLQIEECESNSPVKEHVEEKHAIETNSEQKTETKSIDETTSKEDETISESHLDNEEIEKSNANESNKSQEAENKKKCWTKDVLHKQSRKFNIDLAPKFLFSRGPMVELLISSNVARYLEFKCLTRILTWMEQAKDNLVVVPCSRSDVFTTKVVNIIEKRLLMKFLKFCHRYQDHKDQWEAFANKPFKEFLVQQKLTPTLIHFVTNAIGMVSGDVPCSEGLHETSLFLNSLGRYGSMPFLFSIYGSGEMPQAFCRLCAVFEGVYMLRKTVEGLVLNEATNQVCSLVSEGQRFRCKNVVMDAGYVDQVCIPENSTRKSMSRAVLITDRSMLGSEKENVTLVKMPMDDGGTVTVFELGAATGVCCKDTFLVHLTCEGQDAENDLRMTVERLFSEESAPEEDVKPRILFRLYFNRVIEATKTDNLPSNVYVCSGPDAELDYDFAIEQAKCIFATIFPGVEFLPRAPDPEEIVFEGETAKEDDNFEQEVLEVAQEAMDTEGQTKDIQNQTDQTEDGPKEASRDTNETEKHADEVTGSDPPEAKVLRRDTPPL